MSVVMQSAPAQWFLAAHQQLCIAAESATEPGINPEPGTGKVADNVARFGELRGLITINELADYLVDLLTALAPDLRRATNTPTSWWSAGTNTLFTLICNSDPHMELHQALHQLADQADDNSYLTWVLCPAASQDHDLLEITQPAIDNLGTRGCQLAIMLWDYDEVASQALAVTSPEDLRHLLPPLPAGHATSCKPPATLQHVLNDPSQIDIGALATMLHNLATLDVPTHSQSRQPGLTRPEPLHGVSPARSQRPLRSAAQAMHRHLPGVNDVDAIQLAAHLSNHFLVDHWLAQQTDPKDCLNRIETSFAYLWNQGYQEHDDRHPGESSPSTRQLPHMRHELIERARSSEPESAQQPDTDPAGAMPATWLAAAETTIAVGIVNAATKEPLCS